MLVYLEEAWRRWQGDCHCLSIGENGLETPGKLLKPKPVIGGAVNEQHCVPVQALGARRHDEEEIDAVSSDGASQQVASCERCHAV